MALQSCWCIKRAIARAGCKGGGGALIILMFGGVIVKSASVSRTGQTRCMTQVQNLSIPSDQTAWMLISSRFPSRRKREGPISGSELCSRGEFVEWPEMIKSL
ncbi:hypothetical protein Peur_022423 [Populus x canadensis]